MTIARFLAVALALLAAPAAAQQGERAGLPMVAVPPLPTPKVEQTSAGPTHGIGLQVAEVIAADLRSTGQYAPVGPANLRVYSYPEVTAPMFQQWRSVGAKALVTGFVQARADGRLTIGCYLYDIDSRREVARKGFVVPVADWRRAAHSCAGAVYTALSGKPGMFDTRIAYVAESGPANERNKRIAIMDTDGLNHRFLTPGTTAEIEPALSPDGARLAYTAIVDRAPQVRVVELDTGTERPLLPGTAMTFSPSFSPAGDRLLFSMAVNGNTDLYSIDLRGGPPVRLTSTPGTDTGGSFSPDGTRIVFESDRSGTPQLYVMNADGSGQSRISFGGDRYSAPSWSPTGDRIAFARSSGIGVIGIDGSDERMLTRNPLDQEPSWARSGEQLLFERAGAGGAVTALYAVPVSGGDARRVPTPQGGSDPDWSRVQE